jgi:hypothetical protein
MIETGLKRVKVELCYKCVTIYRYLTQALQLSRSGLMIFSQ